ncbi:MAG: TlpA family protein disulfide reductase [Chloroflexi bacterium]|nr:TlpA family protein disulfide reductase [Chloroflexota bacterium]
MLSVGDQAPPFDLPDLAAKQHRLVDGEAPVLAVFWKPSCATCDLAFPYLQRLYEAYPGDGWRLLAVSQEDATSSGQFAQQYGITFPILIEGDGWPASMAYDPEATPTLFLISPDGAIEHASVGFEKAALNEISEALAKHLGVSSQLIAREDDGNPPFRPG